MSYIIGWKNNRSVFLSGDTLLTSNFAMNTYESRSSFGEELVKSDSHSQSEAYLKIWVIDKLAIGFASNNSYEALEVLELLNWGMNAGQIESSINDALAILSPKESYFLFAFYEKGRNRLFKYDPNFGEIFEENEPTQIGSMPEGQQDQTYEMCAHIADRESKYTDDDSLVFVNSAQQNLLIVQNSMQFSAGGIFTGLYINSEGLHWQPDTIYLNYNVDLDLLNTDDSNLREAITPMSIVQLLIRQNCASYSSGFNDETTKRDNLFKFWASKETNMLPSYIIEERVKWSRECSDEIHALYKCPSPDYFCVFSNDQKIGRNLIIVRSHNGNPFVNISCLENDYYNIIVNMSILKALKPDHVMNSYRYEFVHKND